MSIGIPLMYAFKLGTQAKLITGQLVQAKTLTGQLLPLARDPATGRFVEMAKGVALRGSPIQPLIAPLDLSMGAMHMYQTHRGFTAVLNGLSSIQSSLSVLQATTALIGVGTAVTGVLAAVNLYHTLKLKKAVERLEVKVEDGFIDLKQALTFQGNEILQRIDEASKDIKFEQHRVALIRAYGLFTQALQQLKTAMQLRDPLRRDAEVTAIRSMLAEALADYSNPKLLEELSAAGLIRRMECAWAIEQAIITTYQIQGELSAVSDRLTALQERVQRDELIVIELSKSSEEVEFLFPEITRISSQDVPILKNWQTNADWLQSLSPTEKKFLDEINLQNSEEEAMEIEIDLDEENEGEELYEFKVYEDISQKTNDVALRDYLKFTVKTELRQDYENYIAQQSQNQGLKALTPSSWQDVPDLAIANLSQYFKLKEQIST